MGGATDGNHGQAREPGRPVGTPVPGHGWFGGRGPRLQAAPRAIHARRPGLRIHALPPPYRPLAWFNGAVMVRDVSGRLLAVDNTPPALNVKKGLALCR